MIQRLVEANWFQNRHDPNPERIDFWLRECRTPEILIELVKRLPGEASSLHSSRKAVSAALRGNLEEVEKTLEEERRAEVAADQAYWQPLRKEIERLRRIQSKKDSLQ